MRFPALVCVMAFLLSGFFSTTLADVKNEIDVNFGFADGETTTKVDELDDDADSMRLNFSLAYTRFFKKLVDDETPIDLREFYTHPSKVFVGGGYKSRDLERILPGPPSLIIEDSELETNDVFGGGRYYLPTNTGIGVSGGIGQGTFEDINDTDEDVETYFYQGTLDQYIMGIVNIEGGYLVNNVDVQNVDEQTDTRYFGRAKAAIGKKVPFWINAFFAVGETEEKFSDDTKDWDVMNAALELGHFWQNLSILYGADYEKWDNQDTDDEIKIITGFLSPRLWHNEHYLTAIKFFYRWYEEDTEDVFGRDADFDEDEVGFDIQISFRF